MAFGVASGISKETAYAVQSTDKVGPNGEILEATTHGGKVTVSTEEYQDNTATNEAVNGQVSGVGDPNVESFNIVESNTDYCRVRKTTVAPLAAATTTTTTTTTATT
jgi:hypothetical protein